MKTLDIITRKSRPALKLATRRGNNDYWIYGDINERKQQQNIYHVVVDASCYGICECPDFIYRRAKNREACKHTLEVVNCFLTRQHQEREG